SAAPITAAPSTSPSTRSPARPGKASHRYSTKPSIATATTSRPQPHGGARKMRARRAGIATAAVASPARSTRAVPFVLRAGAAETALALLIVHERTYELRVAEIRPQGVGDVELGVRNLPEEEVGDAHFAAGADEQVGVRKAGGAEGIGHRRLIDRI